MNPDHPLRSTAPGRLPPTAVSNPNADSSSSSNGNWHEAEPDLDLPRFLLVKNLPQHVTEAEVRGLFAKLPCISEIIILKNSTNVYLRLSDLEEANAFLTRKGNLPIHHKGKKLEVCLVSKLPLDLNETSAIVLGTIYKETVEINVKNLHAIFSEFGTLRKMVIFKKKNFQVFVEFASGEEAQFFRGALNNVNYKGLFFLKIQFTRKKELVVSGNNFYEFDFERAQRGELEKVFGQPRVLSDLWRDDQGSPKPSNASKTTQSKPELPSVEFRGPSSEDRPDFGSESSSLPHQMVIPYGSHDGLRGYQETSRSPTYRDGREPGPWSALPSGDYRGLSLPKVPQSGPFFRHPDHSEVVLPSSKVPPSSLSTGRTTLLRTYDLLVSFFNASLKCRHLFNLFSLYGEIASVSVNSYRLAAVVCFVSELGRHKAWTALSSPSVFNDEIVMEVLNQLPEGLVFEDKPRRPATPESPTTRDVFIRERFDYLRRAPATPHEGPSSLTPSASLKICGLPVQIPLQLLTNIFSTVEEVTGVFTSDRALGRVVFEFESIAAACRVLAHFNYLELLDYFLDIAFHTPEERRRSGERTGENAPTNRTGSPPDIKSLTSPVSTPQNPTHL